MAIRPEDRCGNAVRERVHQSRRDAVALRSCLGDGSDEILHRDGLATWEDKILRGHECPDLLIRKMRQQQSARCRPGKRNLGPDVRADAEGAGTSGHMYHSVMAALQHAELAGLAG